MSTPTSSTYDSENNEIYRVTISMIPTLRYLYKNKTLVNLPAKEKPRRPYRADILDRVSLLQGDITTLEVDGIVNAANRSLLGGGGADGAIHRAAGPGLLKECQTLDGAKTGEAKITGGYLLPAKHVIHAVGPVYSSSQREINAEQLTSCYYNSLELAVDHKLKSIAFCSISTGLYRYPIEDATHIALETTRRFLDEERGDALERVIFVVWSQRDKSVYQDLIPEYFPDSSSDPEEEEEAHTGLSQGLEEATINKPESGANN